MSQTQDLLVSFGGGSRGPKTDFIRKFESGTTTVLRLYRFSMKAEDGSRVKGFCQKRKIHFNGPGKAPTECPGDDCDRCILAARLEASGTEEALAKAKDMAATEQAAFRAIRVADPQRVSVLELGWGPTQQVLLQIARQGGWASSYPKADDFKKDPSLASKLGACLERGLEKVCGPTGRNVCITYNKGQGAKTWEVFIQADDNQVLPFLEDDTILSPAEVRAQIEAAMAARNGGGM